MNIGALNNLLQCCAVRYSKCCQQPLFTVDKTTLFGHDFCSNNIITPIVDIEQVLIAEYSSTLSIVHFPGNALRSKIFKKSNGCLLKDGRKAGRPPPICLLSKTSHYYR